MDDHLSRFLAAQHAFGERVGAVTEQQWLLDTPNPDWTVADLVARLASEHRWAAALVHGHDLDSAATIVSGARVLPVDGGVGANLAETWKEAAASSADAFSGDGALARSVQLARGTTATTDYISEMIIDLVVHSWDLQTAIGFAGDLPADLVAAVYADAQAVGGLSSSGAFGEPVEVASDAPTIDKLIGLTGRTPR